MSTLEERWDDFERYVRAAGVSWLGFSEEETLQKARTLALAALQDLFAGYACSLEDEGCECDLHAAVRPIVRRIQALGG